MPSKTPGKLFCVCIQSDPYAASDNGNSKLAWRVVPLSEDQGRAMQKRGVAHIYETSAQAYAVAKRLNEEET